MEFYSELSKDIIEILKRELEINMKTSLKGSWLEARNDLSDTILIQGDKLISFKLFKYNENYIFGLVLLTDKGVYTYNSYIFIEKSTNKISFSLHEAFHLLNNSIQAYDNLRFLSESLMNSDVFKNTELQDRNQFIKLSETKQIIEKSIKGVLTKIQNEDFTGFKVDTLFKLVDLLGVDGFSKQEISSILRYMYNDYDIMINFNIDITDTEIDIDELSFKSLHCDGINLNYM